MILFWRQEWVIHLKARSETQRPFATNGLGFLQEGQGLFSLSLFHLQVASLCSFRSHKSSQAHLTYCKSLPQNPSMVYISTRPNSFQTGAPPPFSGEALLCEQAAFFSKTSQGLCRHHRWQWLLEWVFTLTDFKRKSLEKKKWEPCQCCQHSFSGEYAETVFCIQNTLVFREQNKNKKYGRWEIKHYDKQWCLSGRV